MKIFSSLFFDFFAIFFFQLFQVVIPFLNVLDL